MSTIEEVRAAEKRVQRAVDALRNADALDANHIGDELKKATDEYARLVRELNLKWPYYILKANGDQEQPGGFA